MKAQLVKTSLYLLGDSEVFDSDIDEGDHVLISNTIVNSQNLRVQITCLKKEGQIGQGKIQR